MVAMLVKMPTTVVAQCGSASQQQINLNFLISNKRETKTIQVILFWNKTGKMPSKFTFTESADKPEADYIKKHLNI